MSNLVRLTIRDQPRDLQVKEWQGQRVVTFREIDELHERPAGTAARNFSQHRHRFIEGVDFFRLSYAEANSTNFVELASPNGLTLITESGYLMLVKSFTDDLAWEVQRQLINGYFRAKAAAQFYIPKTYAEALRLAADQAEEIERQKAVIQELTPKAEFHDRVASSGDAISIRDAAKVLGTGQNRLFAWLRGQGILMADNRPYQRYIDAGYFRVIEQPWTDSAGKVHISHKTLVTGKGMTWLQKRWDADHPPSDPPRRRRQLSVVQ